MKTTAYLSVVILLFGLPILCHAQSQPVFVLDFEKYLTHYEDTWMDKKNYRTLRESMRLTYHKPSSYAQVRESECFKEDPKLSCMLTCISIQLKSKDEECIVFIPIFEPITKKDTLHIQYMKRHSPDDPLRVLDMQHIWQIKGNVIRALGYGYDYFIQRRDDVDWRRHLEYYPEKKAGRIFNADTAIRFSLNLEPGKELYNYKGKYKYLDALAIQKMGRGYIMMYVFTTEKGKKNMPRYWKQIEGMFRYED